jgi:ATP-dependent DNA helicase RecG
MYNYFFNAVLNSNGKYMINKHLYLTEINTIADINELISRGESRVLEFKKSVAELESLGKALCGFLNKQGGIGLVGVGDKGKKIGIELTDKIQQKIANFLKKFEPQGRIEVAYVSMPDSNRVIAVFYAEAISSEKPYAYDGRYWSRNQNTNMVMTQVMIDELFAKRISCLSEWDDQIVIKYKLKDLDHAAIEQMVKMGVNCSRLSSTAINQNFTEVLQRLNLLRDGYFTNAAMILFGNNRTNSLEIDYPQCLLKLARFKGMTKLEGFIDNRQLYCHAFQLLDYAETFIQQHVPISSSFHDDISQRDDKLAIPQLALREAIVNSICHRDYVSKKGEVAIAIYDDRLEIWNKGRLPNELSVEDLKKEHASCPRNKLISEIFYKCGYLERWGSGTLRILELCKKACIPEPVFKEYSGGFAVEFRFTVAADVSVAEESEVIASLPPRLQRVFNIIRQYGPISTTEIMTSSDMHLINVRRTLQADLKKLHELGFIKSSGKGRATVWFI